MAPVGGEGGELACLRYADGGAVARQAGVGAAVQCSVGPVWSST